MSHAELGMSTEMPATLDVLPQAGELLFNRLLLLLPIG